MGTTHFPDGGKEEVLYQMKDCVEQIFGYLCGAKISTLFF